uniref:Uncharacterized protein n=1 Tax=Rhizophora mucronata TaxID=61149 RepID=A0A2P2N990_RHIMU
MLPLDWGIFNISTMNNLFVSESSFLG